MKKSRGVKKPKVWKINHMKYKTTLYFEKKITWSEKYQILKKSYKVKKPKILKNSNEVKKFLKKSHEVKTPNIKTFVQVSNKTKIKKNQVKYLKSPI